MAASLKSTVAFVGAPDPASLSHTQMGNCETAAPHASMRMDVAWTSERTRLRMRRKRMPVKTVLSAERIWYVVVDTLIRIRKIRLLLMK